jgi:hypothetical protein
LYGFSSSYSNVSFLSIPCQQLSKECPTVTHHLVETLWWGHRSLDGQGANVLPSLLQERNEVVDSQHDVGDELVLSHANVADSDTHAQNLLQLELDGALDFVDLAAQVFVVGDWGWEFTSYESSVIYLIIEWRFWTYPWRDQDPRDEEFA